MNINDSCWKTCLEDEELEYDLLFVTVSCLNDWLELELDFAMAIAEEDFDLQTALSKQPFKISFLVDGVKWLYAAF